MRKNTYPPVIPEEYWMQTPLSVARHYGGANINGDEYRIVDKTGRDIYELSEIAIKEGRDKAIEPGEPCDLCLLTWIPAYRALGRERIIELIKQGKTLKEVKTIIKAGKANPAHSQS